MSSNNNSNRNNASDNPGNFANRPTEEVKAIASMGGKASHGGTSKNDDDHAVGRNPDGTFTKGSQAAKEAGHLGGLHASGQIDEKIEGDHQPGRNPDGTFTKGSEAAKEAGHIGGLHASGQKDKSEVDVQAGNGPNGGRNPDGTFTKGSDAAKEAGHKGGLAAAASD